MDYVAIKPNNYKTDLTSVDNQIIKKSVLSMIGCSILIIFVLYGDTLAILSEFPILTNNSILKYDETDKESSVVVGDLRFSLPKLVFLYFNGGGVFNRVPDNNIEYALYGRRVGADPTQPWEDLSFIKNCLPYDCRGEIYGRLEFPWHSAIGQASYTTAMDSLLVKIRNKYNREHPQNAVDKVAIYMYWWQRSEDGFYKLKQPESTHWQLIATE